MYGIGYLWSVIFFFFTDSIIHIFVYFEMQILQKVISRARDTIPVRSLSTKEVIMFCHSYSIPNFPFWGFTLYFSNYYYSSAQRICSTFFFK
jgi:hypothetical protein